MIKTNSSTSEIRDFYFELWRNYYTLPLVNHGKESIEEVIQNMQEYNISRDDLININEFYSLGFYYKFKNFKEIQKIIYMNL